MKSRIIILFLIALPTLVRGQIDTKFWFAAPKLYAAHYQDSVKFTVVSFDKPTTVTIMQPANHGFVPITHLMQANEFWEYRLDTLRQKSMLEVTDGIALPWGFQIVSENPVSVNYVAYGNSSEVYTLKGSNGLGKEFIVPTQFTYPNSKYPGVSSFEIVATEDTTDIIIQPSQDCTISHLLVNGKLNIRLNRGETYCVKSSNQTAAGHLRNSIISSNKPIAVNTSDDDVTVGNSVDMIGNQLVPVSMLGTEYIAIKNNGTGGSAGTVENLYFFPTVDNTQIYVNGTVIATLNKGGEKMYPLVNATNVITSNFPIIVFQVSSVGGELGGTMLPKVDCTGSTEVVYKPMLGTATENILVKTIYTGNFTVNGQSGILNSSDFTPVTSNNSWSYCQKVLPPNSNGVIRVKNTSGYFHYSVLDGVPLGKCSYGYFSDFHTVRLNAQSSEISYSLGDNLKLSIQNPLSFSQITWTKPDGAKVVTPELVINNITTSDAGMYRVSASSNDGCTISEDGIVVVNIFQPERTNQGICSGNTATLVSRGLSPYVWSPGRFLNTNSSITVTPAVTTRYTVINQQQGKNIVFNGNFQDDNKAFESAYTYVTPSTTALSISGKYSVYRNAREVNSTYSRVYDHTSGDATNGRHLIANCTAVTGKKVWTKTIDVKPDTQYKLSAWFLSAKENGTQSRLQFAINDQLFGNVIIPPNTRTGTSTYGTKPSHWKKDSVMWTSGNHTTATISIVTAQGITDGSGVCIDDIEFCPYFGVTDTAYVQVTQTPVAAITGDTILCHGQAVLDGGTFANGNPYSSYSWYKGNSGTTIGTQRYQTVSESGDYRLVVSNQSCSDETTYKVKPANRINVNITPDVSVCQSEPNFPVSFQVIEGEAGKYNLYYDTQAKAAGFADKQNELISESELSVSLPTGVAPGIYHGQVQVISKAVCAESELMPLTIEVKIKPESIMRQKWSNVLALMNKDYNGGYEFSSYQWYKNGTAIEGATGSYYYTGSAALSISDTYSVIVKLKDGTELKSCEFTPQVSRNIRTIYSVNEPIEINQELEGSTITLTDTRGIVYQHKQLKHGDYTIKAPASPGIYILNTGDKGVQIKIIVK